MVTKVVVDVGAVLLPAAEAITMNAKAAVDADAALPAALLHAVVKDNLIGEINMEAEL